MYPSCWDPVWLFLSELSTVSPARGRDSSVCPSSHQLALSKEQTQRHAGPAILIPDVPPGWNGDAVLATDSFTQKMKGRCCQEICIYIHMYMALAACK